MRRRRWRLAGHVGRLCGLSMIIRVQRKSLCEERRNDGLVQVPFQRLSIVPYLRAFFIVKLGIAKHQAHILVPCIRIDVLFAFQLALHIAKADRLANELVVVWVFFTRRQLHKQLRVRPLVAILQRHQTLYGPPQHHFQALATRRATPTWLGRRRGTLVRRRGIGGAQHRGRRWFQAHGRAVH